MEKGYERTAEVFRNDTQLTEPKPHEPPGLLLDFWNYFYDQFNSRARLRMEQTSRQNQQPSNSSMQSQDIEQQPSNSSTQSQVLLPTLDISYLMNTTTAQKIWDEAQPIQHHSSFGSEGNVVASGGHGAHEKKPEIGLRFTVHDALRQLETARVPLDLQREIEIPKRFNLSPSMVDLLKRNVPMYAAAFRENTRLQLQMKANLSGRSVMSNLDSPVVSRADVVVDPCGHSRFSNTQDDVNSILSNVSELSDDLKEKLMMDTLFYIKYLEEQVKEQKEWALRTALKADRKLSDDINELQTLRMEREETQKVQAVEDTGMEESFSKTAKGMRTFRGQMDRATEDLKRLETENAEIRAEMEAFKLSASESVTASSGVKKKEKKQLKKLRAWEKQKAKLQEEVSDMKEKVSKAQEVLDQTWQLQKEAEAKLEEELKAQEDASALVREEYLAKKTAELNNETELEALRVKIDIDVQRHKDDIRRLEHDLSRLRASAHSAELHHQSNTSPMSEFESGISEHQRESIARLLRGMDNMEDLSEKEARSRNNRECIICMKDDVSVVFLPCTHQVMCAQCSDEYGKKGNACCPCCRVQIQLIILVSGAGS